MLWGALRSCYGAESEAVAAAARNTGTILPYLNSPSNIKGCYAVLVELLGSEQATEVCAKNPGILQCNPRVLAPERGPKVRLARGWSAAGRAPGPLATPATLAAPARGAGPRPPCRSVPAAPSVPGRPPPASGRRLRRPRATRLGPTLAEARPSPLPPSQAREQPDALLRAAETARLPLSKRCGRSASGRVWGAAGPGAWRIDR